MDAEIIIIGAGLAGTSAAIVLGRAGYRVALVDTHAEYPAEFRAEKMGLPHMARFESLGLGELLMSHVQRLDEISVARYGRVVSKSKGPDYAFRYGSLVNGMRAALPPHVSLIVGRISDIATSDERQTVTMADGTMLEARLLIVATGLGDSIRSRVGIERVRLSRSHSMAFGFTLKASARDVPFTSLVYYGDGPSDRLAYCTLFPLGETVRANLYAYRTAGEDWTRQFRQTPEAVLRSSMPGLAAILPDLSVDGPTAIRSIDLTVAQNYNRAGVVLIGDAFSTCCPIPGVGLLKVATDVAQLTTRHIPRWFDSPGMGADKIGTFYDDAIKKECDAHGLRASLYSRAIATEPGVAWAARRLRNHVARRSLYAAKRARHRFLSMDAVAS